MNNPHIERALSYSGGLCLVTPGKVSGNDGRRIGNSAGNALEFAEYREYRPGDDIRRLDWGVLARSDQYMVRQFNDEVDPRCDIVLDHSASMSAPQSKANAALGLAALLADAASNGGFSLNVWHASETWEKEAQPFSPLIWQDTEFKSQISPGEGLETFTGTMLRHGMRIAISDFLWTEHPEVFIRRLSQNAKQTLLLRLDFDIGLSETDFGPMEIFDSETGHSKEFILDRATLDKYRQRCVTHRNLWNEAAAKYGAQIIEITEEDIEKSFAVDILASNGIITVK